MRNILQEIAAHKRKEVDERKELYPVKLLEKSIYFPTTPVSLKKYITREDKSGVIAEFKRKSPSKGMINPYASVEETTIGYMMANASALSVLTDKAYFGGSDEDLTTARKFNFCPILRKDFVLDPYQVVEAKSIGADAVLLIAALLDKHQIDELGSMAQSLGMEVLLEVHNEDELNQSSLKSIDLVGVNNRDLATFDVDINISKSLAARIPDEFVKVTESGISDIQVMAQLRQHGYEGFLIGEHFMKHSLPHRAAMKFIGEYMSLIKS